MPDGMELTGFTIKISALRATKFRKVMPSYIPVCMVEWLGMQIPLANFIGRFSKTQRSLGLPSETLMSVDILSPFPPSGNEGYDSNQDILTKTSFIKYIYIYKNLFKKPQISAFNPFFKRRDESKL